MLVKWSEAECPWIRDAIVTHKACKSVAYPYWTRDHWTALTPDHIAIYEYQGHTFYTITEDPAITGEASNQYTFGPDILRNTAKFSPEMKKFVDSLFNLAPSRPTVTVLHQQQPLIIAPFNDSFLPQRLGDTIENLRMMPNPRLEWWSERQITDKPFPFKKSADMLAIELITQFTDQAMAGNGVVYIGAVNVKHANSSAPAPKKHRNNPSD